MRIKHAIITALLVGLGHAAIAAPATLTQSVTYDGETITLQLTKENLRGANFELWAQNASGGYDVITPVLERSYLGTVDEYPGVVSCGILQDDGTFRGAVYFDRGEAWYTLGTAVVETRGLDYDAFSDFHVPTAPSVTAGQPGTTMYGYDVGVDVDNDYYSAAGSTAKTFERIEFSVCAVRAIYMRDVLLRPYLGRVILRAVKSQDPYDAVGGGDYLDALRLEWNTNHTDADRDVVAGVTNTDVGGGLAWLGVIGTSSAYSVNDTYTDGDFSIVWRHEMAHNWSCGHAVGGHPEGTGLMGGNWASRITGCEAHLFFTHRDSKLGIIDSMGTYGAVDLPPYGALDSAIFTHGIDSQITFDVMENDYDANGDSFSISSFDTTSVNGGTISQQGANLVYMAQGSFIGNDSFTYTIQDSSGQTATGAVVVQVDILPAGTPVAITNHSFEDGSVTSGPPTGWTMTAGNGNDQGVADDAPGGSDGSQFYWCGAGEEITQDLGHILGAGEEFILQYDSQKWAPRNIQLLAKRGGNYSLLAEHTEEIGWSGWAPLTLNATVPSQKAGDELAIRIKSGGWNEFDNFRITTVSGASSPSPFDGATDVGPVDLSWVPLGAATQHHVYLGTSQNAVQGATTASAEYQGAVASSIFTVATATDTTYYWRVDTDTSQGTDTGEVWSFSRGSLVYEIFRNASFENGAQTGVPDNWILTAGSSSDVGVDPGGSEGAKFLWIGPGCELTQDLAYTLTNGEDLTLLYASSQTRPRNIQLLAKSGGNYTLMAETTLAEGSSQWPTVSPLDYTVSSSYAGDQLAVRIISHDWNEFDDFRLTTGGGQPNNAPTWNSNPVVETDATEDASYSATLANDATDADSDPLTFSKVSGPAWLSVAANGDLSGTPASGDVGANSWTVDVSDGIAAPVQVALNITVAAVGGPAADFAVSEATALGTVSGSMSDTVSNNDTYEVITEEESGGNPSKRRSQLEHTWTFNVTGGELVTFYVEAHHTANSEGDDFVFAYSTDNVNFTDMVTVTKTADDNTAQFYSLPGGLSGTVYIRVLDTDRSQGNRVLDSLYVDALLITSESASTPPGQASSPSPANGATGVSLTPSLSWTAGTLAASHDVYFGIDPTPDAGEFQGNQAGTSFSPGTLTASTTYYWAVDEVNGSGTTAGPIWSFITGTGGGSPDMHVESIVLSTQSVGPRRKGVATVTIVESVSGLPVAGATVSGDFTGAFGESQSAVTDASGTATLTTSAKVSPPLSFTFTVTDVSEAGHVYNAANNVETSDSGSF